MAYIYNINSKAKQEKRAMKMDLKRNINIAPLLGEKKGWNIVVEILVFLAVMLLCMIGQAIVTVPIESALLFNNAGYMAAVQSGDAAAIMDATNAVLSNESFTVLSLAAEFVIIAIVLGFCALCEKRKPWQVGFAKKNILKEYGVGLALGFAVFSVAVLLAALMGAVRLSFAGGGVLLVFFAAGFMIQGMAEEVLCRGYLMCSVARRYPLWVGILANSVVFASLHLLNSGISALAFINLVLYGIFASLYFVRRGNIWGIGAFHAVWNFVQGNFYGIQVSGTGKMTSVFASSFTEGRELIYGGAFGLEGGLAVSSVLAVGIVLLYLEPWKKAEAA